MICKYLNNIGISIGILTILFMFCCNSNRGTSPPIEVSIVQLRMFPEKYRGKKIKVHGYLANAEILRLFLSREYAWMKDRGGSIYVFDTTPQKVILRNESCYDNYVTITGIFDYVDHHFEWGISSIRSFHPYNFELKENFHCPRINSSLNDQQNWDRTGKHIIKYRHVPSQNSNETESQSIESRD